MSNPTDIEKENLETHVELCALRYGALENRLESVENKIGKLHSIIENSHASTVKVLIGTAGTVIVGVLSLVGVILTKMP